MGPDHQRGARAFMWVCIALLATFAWPGSARAALRVCADPNNLPFTDSRGRGYENMLAQMLSEDLGMALEYEWTSQARGSLDVALEAHLCDLILGTPWRPDASDMTKPYYRSHWVFVTRSDRGLQLRTIKDLHDQSLRVGLRQPNASRPSSATARLLTSLGNDPHVQLFSRYRAAPMPSGIRTLIDAVTFGDIDVAIAWGPAASYFAVRSTVPLRVQPIRDANSLSPEPVADVAMRVRADEPELLSRINGFLDRRANDIRQLLSDYRVPVVTAGPEGGVL